MRIEELLDFLDTARSGMTERLYNIFRTGGDGICALLYLPAVLCHFNSYERRVSVL